MRIGERPRIDPPLAGADHHHGTRARQSRRDGFAQRPGRDHAAIADAVAAIDHHQRDIVRERRILEPVIEQQQIGAGSDRRTRRRNAIRADPARRCGSEQQRLIADLARAVARRIDLQRAGEAAAITAA